MNKIYYNESLRERAKELRRKATPQENKLWYRFLKKHSAQFRRQKQFARYIVDFYCSSARLVIEIDGEQHGTHEGMAHDKARTAYLQELGLHVIRFSNREVDSCFESVCSQIDRVVKQRIFCIQNSSDQQIGGESAQKTFPFGEGGTAKP